MSGDASRGRRFARCLVFEGRKLLGRRLPFFALAIVVATGLVTGWLDGRRDEPPHGWLAFASILATALPVAGFFPLIMGSLAVNEEVASGAMRATLLRPIDRVELLGAKLVTLVALAILLGGAAVAGAWTWVIAHGGFGPILLEIGGIDPIVRFDDAIMHTYAHRLLLAALPGLLCAPLLGALVSILVEAPGAAVTVAVLAGGALYALGGASDALVDWAFPASVGRSLALLDELARGFKTNEQLVASLGPTSRQVVIPAATAAALAGLALVTFQWKEIRA